MRTLMLCLALAACGPSADTPLTEVDEAGWSSLCGDLDPARTATCDVDGVEIDQEVPGPETCAATLGPDSVLETCQATVGDFRDCMDALADDPCALLADPRPTACERTAGCVPL